MLVEMFLLQVVCSVSNKKLGEWQSITCIVIFSSKEYGFYLLYVIVFSFDLFGEIIANKLLRKIKKFSLRKYGGWAFAG